MVKRNRIDDHEFIKVVLERDVISVPGDDIERAVTLSCGKQLALILADDRVIGFKILVARDRRLKVSGIRQAVRSCFETYQLSFG